MQMLANISRIYPVETLPSMKTHSIVPFKRLCLVGGGGGGWREGEEGVNGHTRFLIY